MENFNIEEIRKLKEEVEALRRDIARLDGRMDAVQHFFWKIEERDRQIEEEQMEDTANV